MSHQDTTKENLVALVQTLTDLYAQQLTRLPMKKATREILVDGFRDGARTAAWKLCEMLEVKVAE